MYSVICENHSRKIVSDTNIFCYDETIRFTKHYK